MSTRLSSAIPFVLSALLLGSVGLAASPVSATEQDGGCDAATDAVVTVDAAILGGEYTSLCVQDAIGMTAVEVVEATGIPVELTDGSGGDVCQIDGHPSSAVAECGDTSVGRWSLYTADVDGPWRAIDDDPTTYEVSGGELVSFVFTPVSSEPTAPEQPTSADLFASTALVPDGVKPAGDASSDDTAAAGADTGSVEDGSTSTWLVAGLLTAVVVVVALGVLVLRRRDRQR